ncbi:MAG: DUF5934 domain-containing protein [Comamonadaceae bacterium]|nr:DUF5934 domain-containing protein [Comamonadaceae bacterium]
MGSLIGDLMQPALQYSAPFLLTMGVHVLDPNVIRSRSSPPTTCARRRTPAARWPTSCPTCGKKLQDWTAAADAIDAGGSLVEPVPPARASSPRPSKAVAAQETAKAIWRGRGFELNADAYMHRQALLASLPMTLSAKLPRRPGQDAPRHAQDHGQRHPSGAADRRVARHAHADAGVRRTARPADDAGHLTTTTWATTTSPSSARPARASRC